MSNWYTTRDAVKRAGNINGAAQNARVDRAIEAASRQIDNLTRRFFIPRTETRLFRWPQRLTGRGYELWLDADLLSITTLQSKAQNTSPVSIASTDYFLEPANFGPPYNSVEIDLSSTASFDSGDTPQRSISVNGSWGYGNDTKSAGTVSSGLASSATATSFVASDGSLVGVGNTLLIESEQIFVSGVANAQVGTQQLDGALTANQAEVSVTVDDGTQFNAGEIVLVESERVYIESISGNVLAVVRAYDGSTLAAHSDNTAVHAFRTFTIERGANGTTAATHANSTAISSYEPPFDIAQLCIAETLAAFHQEGAGWGRVVGTGDGAGELNGRSLSDLRRRVIGQYRRVRTASV